MNGFSQTITAKVPGGDWNSTATWDTGVVPTSANSSQIRIPSGSTVRVVTAVTISQLTVLTGGTLELASTAVSTLPPTGSIGTVTSGIIFQNGAIYNHNQNGGVIPTATWQTGSTCKVTGWVAAAAAATFQNSLAQSFHHFTWNCLGQTQANVLFAGKLTTVNGDLTISNTNAAGAAVQRRVILGFNAGSGTATTNVVGNLNVTGPSLFGVNLGSGASGVYTLNVTGNMVVNSTNTSTVGSVLVNSTSGTSTVNIHGNLQVTAGTVVGVGSGTVNLNVTGDVLINGGTFNFCGSGGGGTTNLNIAGNLALNGGTWTRSAGTGNVKFSGGTGSHTYTLGTTVLANLSINYWVDINNTLDLGTYMLGPSGGAGFFTNDGTVIVRSLSAGEGAVAGNIPIQNRTFSVGSKIIYAGAGPQSMGISHPQDAGVDTDINNASGVTLTGDAFIGGDLTLQNGTLHLAEFRLGLNGNLVPNSNVLDITGGLSSLEINGSGAFGLLPLSGGPAIANFMLNRSGSTVALNSSLTVSGSMDQFDGILELNDRTLTVLGEYNGGGGLTSTAASSLIIDNAGALPVLQITGPMNTLTLNARGENATLDVSGSSFEVTNLNLVTSALTNDPTLTIAAGGVITRTHGTMSTSPGGTGSYNLVYANTGPITTDTEFHTDPDRINDVTITGGGDVAVLGDHTVNGVLTLAAAGFDAAGSILTLHGNLVADAPAIFTSSTLVFGGTTFITGSAIPELGNITVQNGATLNLPTDLSVAGTFVVNSLGILNNNSGTVTLTSSAAQTVDAHNAIFYNLTVNNGGGNNVTLLSPLQLAGMLTMTSSGSDFISNGNLTLLSTSDSNTGNASIGPLGATNTVVGNVIVQRYMSSEGRIYRYLSSPVTNAPVTQMQDDFPVTGNFTGTTPKSASGCSGCSKSPSMAYFNAATNAYVNYPVATNAELLQPGRGYSTFIRDDMPFPGTGPITWDVTGPINQGDVNLPIVHRTGATTTWNLLGNPYPATVSWDNVSGWTKTNVGSIAVRDNAAGGIYLYWNEGVGDPDFGGQIATGQGFWALTTGASPTLTIHEQAKSSTGTLYREGEKNVLTVKLTRGAFWDRAFVRLDDDAIKGLDRLDATKLSNDNFGLSTRFASGETGRMAINSVDRIACGSELILDLQFTKSGTAFVMNPAGSYTMDFKLLGSKFQPYKMTLVDQYTGNRQVVSDNASVSITMTAEPASYAADRFKLVFDGPDITLPTAGAPVVCGDNGEATLVIEDSEADFEYYLLGTNQTALSSARAGNGSDLALTVAASSLAQGPNVINVGVRGFCGETTLTNTWQVIRQVVTTPEVTGGRRCLPGSVELSAIGADASGSYRWYETMDATTSVGNGTTWVTPVLSKSETYYASIVTAEGCEGVRQPAQAEVVLYDDVVITASDGDVLTSSYQTDNQWYFNDQPIAGASNPTYKAEKSGLYEVEVSVDGCATKGTLEYVVTGIEEVIASISGYPNPTWKEINVSLKGSVQEINAIDVTSVTGQTVGQVRLQGTSQEKSGMMNVEQLLQGVYLMRIQLPTRTMVLKFVKQ